MIAPNSSSYPYLAIAQHYGVDYGKVLRLADALAGENIQEINIAAHDLPTECDGAVCAVFKRLHAQQQHPLVDYKVCTCAIIDDFTVVTRKTCCRVCDWDTVPDLTVERLRDVIKTLQCRIDELNDRLDVFENDE